MVSRVKSPGVIPSRRICPEEMLHDCCTTEMVTITALYYLVHQSQLVLLLLFSVFDGLNYLSCSCWWCVNWTTTTCCCVWSLTALGWSRPLLTTSSSGGLECYYDYRKETKKRASEKTIGFYFHIQIQGCRPSYLTHWKRSRAKFRAKHHHRRRKMMIGFR